MAYVRPAGGRIGDAVMPAPRNGDDGAPAPDVLTLHELPLVAQWYVGVVIVAGAAALIALFPTTYPRPWLFAALLVAACLASLWKVNLPISLANRRDLSVAHAAEFMSLLLLGPRLTMLVAVAGAWTQCTFRIKQRYPRYRTAFSVATQALTILVTALAYDRVGGPLAASDFSTLSGPLIAAMATYFLVNSGLIAGAIALSTDQPFGKLWRHDFLWSAVSFMVAGSAGAVAAVVVQRGDQWIAVLMLAPVYLTYLTYQLFVKRLEDQARYVAETRQLNQETVEALLMARQAARALSDEKERLTVTLRSVGDGVITTDLDSTILSMNRVAEALTGWTQDEAIGKPLADVFQNFDPGRQRCDNAIMSSSPTRGREVAGFVRAGRPRFDGAPDRGKHRADSRRRGAHHFSPSHITDVLRMREERAKASSHVARLLAGGMAHDFTNILMAVMGNLSMARADVAAVLG